MKAYSSAQNIIPVVIIIFLTAFVTMGFKDPVMKNYTSPVKTDTIPSNQSIDIHINMSDVNKAMEEVNRQLKKIEWDKISEDVKSSIRKIDMDKISNDVETSLNSIDWKKIQNDIDRSLRDIELGNIDIEIHNALREKEINMSRKELQKLHEVKLKEARKQLERAKEELKRTKKELDQIKINKNKNRNIDEVKNILPAPAKNKTSNKNVVVTAAFPFLEKLGFFHFI